MCDRTYTCDMTHSYVWQDLYMWHDSFICVTWLVDTWCPSLMCDITYSYVTSTPSYVWHGSFIAWHDLFICVTWLTDTWCPSFMCDVGGCCMCHDSNINEPCVPWIIYNWARRLSHFWHICDMIYKWYDSWIRETPHLCLTHMCNVVLRHMWHASHSHTQTLHVTCDIYLHVTVVCDMTHACHMWHASHTHTHSLWISFRAVQKRALLSYSYLIWNKSCHIRMSYVTYGRGMSQITHRRPRRGRYCFFVSHMKWVMSRMHESWCLIWNDSCHVCMSHVTNHLQEAQDRTSLCNSCLI